MLDQIDLHWTSALRPRLEGLTDDEYLWEPVDGCWTVRRTEDGRFAPDWQVPEPVPPPVTTIAWRLCHGDRCRSGEAGTITEHGAVAHRS